MANNQMLRSATRTFETLADQGLEFIRIRSFIDNASLEANNSGLK